MKRYLYLLVAFCIVGCVDKDIDLGNVQGNIGITADKLTFPLAYMEEQSLDKLLGETIEGVNVDSQTGDYSISYGVENQSLVIDGVTNTFSIPGSVFEMEVDYPSFKLSDSKCVIDNTFDLNSKLGGLDLDFGDLHTVRNRDGIQIHIRQTSGTGNHGTDGTGSYVGRKHFTLIGCELLPHLPLQETDTGHNNHRKYHYDGHHRNDDLAPFSLLVFSQCFKQDIIPLGAGCICLFLLFCH